MSCRDCQAQFAIVHGVPQFVTGDDYWGEIPVEDMRELLAAMQDSHWLDALEHLESPIVRTMRSFIADHRRGNWIYELPVDAGSRILDVGCGMGSVAAALSVHVGQVVALESVELRAAFCATRFAQDGLDNIRVVRADAISPPFPPRHFDVIVLHGVLEWLGKGRWPDVRGFQRRALARFRQLLRPDGNLVIAIENRFAVGSFRGRVDHSYLRHTSVMPRWLADRVTRARRGHPYDTYTYGHGGYLKLLREAGFDQVRTMLPIWSYNDPDYLVPVERRIRPAVIEMLASTQGRAAALPALRKLERRFRLSRTLAEDYLFVARTGAERHRSWLRQYLSEYWHEWGFTGDAADLQLVFRNGTIPTALVFSSAVNHPQVVAKLAPRHVAGAFSPPVGEIDALREVRSMLPAEMQRRVPRPLDLRQLHGHDVGVLTGLAGSPAILAAGTATDAATRRSAGRLSELGFGWLDDYYRHTEKRRNRVLCDELESYVRGGGRHLGPEGKRLEAGAMQLLRRRWPATGLDLRHAPQHGDFALNNVVEVDGGLGVFDWERFGRLDLPGFDALNFATNLTLIAVSDRRQWRPAESVTSLLSAGALGDVVRHPLAKCLTSLGIDPGCLDALLGLYFLAYAREYGENQARRGMMRVIAEQLATLLERE